MMVRPFSASVFRLAITVLAAKLSRPEVGSSANSNGGSVSTCTCHTCMYRQTRMSHVCVQTDTYAEKDTVSQQVFGAFYLKQTARKQ